MKHDFHPERKPSRGFRRPQQRGASVRSALVLDLATRFAAIDAALMYAAHQPWPLMVASAAAAFVGAYKFLDGEIEDLTVSMICGLRQLATCGRAAVARPPG